MVTKSFDQLLEVHGRLDALFAEHQRALLRLDTELAQACLEDYERALLAHMQDEEELLLPIYGARARIPLGGSVEIFRNEHRKMREYLLLFKQEMPKLRGACDLEGAVIWLLDSQTTFKRLHVHHDTRERKMLYPLLDEVTTEQERAVLFAQLTLPPYSLLYVNAEKFSSAVGAESR
jgi:regulator of cell morphogenesis and NO signaling